MTTLVSLVTQASRNSLIIYSFSVHSVRDAGTCWEYIGIVNCHSSTPFGNLNQNGNMDAI
jgi:hypothetical protein